jgi:hypothetical protein
MSFERPYADIGDVLSLTSYGERFEPSKMKSVESWISNAPTSFAASARNSTAEPLIAFASPSFASASSTLV